MENRKSARNEKLCTHEPRGKLLHDDAEKAFDEGQLAAKEAFGKLREILSKEKEKRK